jgi:hypothetical protein
MKLAYLSTGASDCGPNPITKHSYNVGFKDGVVAFTGRVGYVVRPTFAVPCFAAAVNLAKAMANAIFKYHLLHRHKF